VIENNYYFSFIQKSIHFNSELSYINPCQLVELKYNYLSYIVSIVRTVQLDLYMATSLYNYISKIKKTK